MGLDADLLRAAMQCPRVAGDVAASVQMLRSSGLETQAVAATPAMQAQGQLCPWPRILAQSLVRISAAGQGSGHPTPVCP